MEPTKETAPEPTNRELLVKNLQHLRAHTNQPNCEQVIVLLTAELVLELTQKQPALLPVA